MVFLPLLSRLSSTFCLFFFLLAGLVVRVKVSIDLPFICNSPSFLFPNSSRPLPLGDLCPTFFLFRWGGLSFTGLLFFCEMSSLDSFFDAFPQRPFPAVEGVGLAGSRRSHIGMMDFQDDGLHFFPHFSAWLRWPPLSGFLSFDPRMRFWRCADWGWRVWFEIGSRHPEVPVLNFFDRGFFCWVFYFFLRVVLFWWAKFWWGEGRTSQAMAPSPPPTPFFLTGEDGFSPPSPKVSPLLIAKSLGLLAKVVWMPSCEVWSEETLLTVRCFFVPPFSDA